MPEQEENNRQDQIHSALDQGALNQVKRLIEDMAASDIAHLIQSSTPARRAVLWTLLEREEQGEVLPYLSEEIRTEQLSQYQAKDIVQLLDELDNDDFADILQELPQRVLDQVLNDLSEENRRLVEQVLHYDEDTAGGLMDTNFITVRPNISAEVVLRYLRMHEKLPDNLDALLVINRKSKLVGRLTLQALLVANPEAPVRDIMETNFDQIDVNLSSQQVAQIFERHDLISAPVVSETGDILGRITIDDVVDVIRDEASNSLLSMAGLNEDSDTFAPVTKTAQQRAVWLGINLITAIIASSVIYSFEETIGKVVYLAAIMPIVASMGGIAGSQTLTLVIRAMALGQLSSSNTRWLLQREVISALLNGLLWAVTIGIFVAYWFQDIHIGWILGLALIVNLITAALAGALIPLGLQKLKIDPALAGGVILTTLTDVIGFFAFLGLATLWYL